ncbi:DUF6090 family protein [Muriicola sp. Z0-33]|uniref:DUF6090 family protein n=1 Tax=Muriicola sp. Z0-33 TaxID=2816957 RepID=UPI00223741E4|nr:DUF6090 family protein [Muriicola sp. Z0-33]MCW5518162.1 hypothetical protein [Muriicola sp. Z0-33]
MIKFFRKIRQNLLSEGKTGKYLKYAIGEILLVVFGILIALQINIWNEHRKNQNTLSGYLTFLMEDIENDKYQLVKLIQEREASLESTTKIINSYRSNIPISAPDFLHAFNYIVVEQKFDNNTNGFDKVQNSPLFDSEGFHRIRNLIRDYTKAIDQVKFVESKQNTSSEIMESELLRNGFYDNTWEDFREYYQPDIFQSKSEKTNYLNEINNYNQIKAIFMRNEWALPFIIEDYKRIIDLGERLKLEIDSFQGNREPSYVMKN